MTTIEAKNDGVYAGLTATISENGNFPKVTLEGCGYTLTGELRSSWHENPWKNHAKMWLEIELTGLSRNIMKVQVQKIVCKDLGSLNWIADRNFTGQRSEKSIIKFSESLDDNDNVESFEIFPRVNSFELTGPNKWVTEWDENDSCTYFNGYEKND